jgi:molecular chaperone HtpG
MTEERQEESLEFRTEVQQLLNILANSLYTEREIFLRELISNSSDALHRIQFEMLTNRDILDPDAELAIYLDLNEHEHAITVSDTGTGMTREELIENLGTIAHSGAMAFLNSLGESQRPEDIIGQFGVGFYSVFTVAEEVSVTTRSYLPEEQAWRWTSRGDRHFSLSPSDKETRGTVIEVKLKEDALEFATAWRLEQTVKKHSDYVSFPIYLNDKPINQQTALWRELPADVEESDYVDFYRQLTLDFEPPMTHIHMVTDVPVNIRGLLFFPRQRERGFMRVRPDYGLKLYSKKILIQEYNKDLLPDYLGFVDGVVDSEDIPLNISRETVQRNPVIRMIKRALTSRITKGLRELAEDRPDDYGTFWLEFGQYIKQGVTTDPSSHKELLPLLRFHSSTSGDELVSLADYVERMPEEQESIYYILGSDRASVAHSPHLDYFRSHDIEVLYLLDPLDGFMVQALPAYDDKSFHNVDDADLEFDPDTETEPEIDTGTDQADMDRLIDRFKNTLADRVTDVRESYLLTDSPCRLVSSDAGPERDLQRVRHLLGKQVQIEPKIMELNRHHPLIQNMADLISTQADEALVTQSIEQLFENMLVLEGLHPNPALMVPRIHSLLEVATRAGAVKSTGPPSKKAQADQPTDD